MKRWSGGSARSFTALAERTDTRLDLLQHALNISYRILVWPLPPGSGRVSTVELVLLACH